MRLSAVLYKGHRLRSAFVIGTASFQIMVSVPTQRLSLCGLVSLFLTVISFLTSPGSSWSHTSHRGRLIQSGRATASPLFVKQQPSPSHRRRATTKLYSGEKEDSEDLEESTSASETAKNPSTGEDEDEKFGVVKTILLAGPLFIKFTIVLL